MKIEKRLLRSSIYLTLIGELDTSTAEAVRDEMDNIDIDKAERIVVDLSKLDFMDSTGIGVFLGRYKKFKEKNVQIFISSPKPNVDKILNLSGIYEIMPKI
ncbi:MAG: STAS domain-containing protein [Firmicutes bacterium]|nr:STAS domain-containing protein [Bacillota bacterium]